MSYNDHHQEALHYLSTAEDHDKNGNIEQAVMFYEASYRSFQYVLQIESDDHERKLLQVKHFFIE